MSVRVKIVLQFLCREQKTKINKIKKSVTIDNALLNYNIKALLYSITNFLVVEAPFCVSLTM